MILSFINVDRTFLHKIFNFCAQHIYVIEKCHQNEIKSHVIKMKSLSQS